MESNLSLLASQFGFDLSAKPQVVDHFVDHSANFDNHDSTDSVKKEEETKAKFFTADLSRLQFCYLLKTREEVKFMLPYV